MAPKLFANGIVNFDQSILFTDPMVTDVCDIPLGKEKGGVPRRLRTEGTLRSSVTHAFPAL